jgi:hypothetical protein
MEVQVSLKWFEGGDQCSKNEEKLEAQGDPEDHNGERDGTTERSRTLEVERRRGGRLYS